MDTDAASAAFGFEGGQALGRQLQIGFSMTNGPPMRLDGRPRILRLADELRIAARRGRHDA